MKTLRIISGVEIDGKHRKEGDIVKNVDNGIAAELVVAGRAEVIPAKAKEIVIRDPEVENRDPKPAPVAPQPKAGKPAKPAKGEVDAPPEA